MSRAMLGSVDEIVDAVGGCSKAASLCGVGLSAVSNWKAVGFIPPRHFFAFAEEIGRRDGCPPNRAIFGFKAK
jgi:hypothetical protein